MPTRNARACLALYTICFSRSTVSETECRLLRALGKTFDARASAELIWAGIVARIDREALPFFSQSQKHQDSE